MEETLESLASRVDDIEQTIGDIYEVLASVKQALGRIPTPPNCPPYCAHEIPEEYVDNLPLEDRVIDIRKCIGDVGIVFGSLVEALDRMAPPNCPPYCGHISQKKSGS
jgi:hypothetical protein